MTACSTCGQPLPIKAEGPGWTFTLGKRLQSANRYLVNHGASRWAYAKERNEWYLWLVKAQREHGIPKATGKRHVEIVRLYSGRERLLDPDNLAASTKALLDSMAHPNIRLLVDDSAAFVDVDWSQERAKESGVRITIREAA